MPTLSPQEESSLIAQVTAGDQQAAATLVKTYSPQMLAVARRMMHSDEDANDALQDAFISAFKALPKFGATARLATWLHRITVNSALMKLRSAAAHKQTSIDALLPTFDSTGHRNLTPAATQSPAASPVAAAQTSETQTLIRHAINQLPESFRTVLLLRDIEELDTAETARLLDTTEANVKTRLHRARQALKTLIEPVVGKL